MQPQASDRSRICLNFSRDGLNVYANRQALMDLRDQLTWLIDSPSDDPYHCHVLMALENDESKFDGKRPRNAGVVFDDDASDMFKADIEGGEVVDLSFFLMSDPDLDDMQVRQK
jgi:hypothetical protein